MYDLYVPVFKVLRVGLHDIIDNMGFAEILFDIPNINLELRMPLMRRLYPVLDDEVVHGSIKSDWQGPFHAKRLVIHTRNVPENRGSGSGDVCQDLDRFRGLAFILEGESFYPDLVMGVRLWKIGRPKIVQ